MRILLLLRASDQGQWRPWIWFAKAEGVGVIDLESIGKCMGGCSLKRGAFALECGSFAAFEFRSKTHTQLPLLAKHGSELIPHFPK